MSVGEQRQRRGGRGAIISGTILGALALFSGGWAAQEVLSPPSHLMQETPATTVTVRQGTLSSYFDVQVAASWHVMGTAANRRSGTVTSLDILPGQAVQQGQTVYTVDLLPVSVAQGKIPMYRPISKGAKGADVAQLQQMLAALGYDPGSKDGIAGQATDLAIRRWQRDLGEEQTGVVDLGRVMFMPNLPTRVNPLKDFQVGKVVGGGEEAFEVMATQPDFHANLTELQARQISQGQLVEITSPSGEKWKGKTGAVSTDADKGGYTVSIEPFDGASVCMPTCDAIPTGSAESSMRGRVVLQTDISGAVIPTAALLSLGDGATVVVTDEGDEIEVTVVASINGQSIVEGVDLGTELVAPVEDEKTK